MTHGLRGFLLNRYVDRRLAAVEAIQLAERIYTPPEDWTVEYQWGQITHCIPSGGHGSGFIPGAPTPSEVRADCDTLIDLVNLHARIPSDVEGQPGWRCPVCGWDYAHTGVEDGCQTLRLLARPFTGHPDFRAEWVR